jgi:histidine triad (HIT) family protein
MSTLFTKIANREIPGNIVYEDEHVFAFLDIHPVAPVHIIIATRQETPGISALPAQGDHMHLLNAAKTIAEQQGLKDFRLVINNGAGAGQTVPHLHVHLLGGKAFSSLPD